MHIDITRYLGTIQREVSVREHEGKQARVITASRIYETEIEDAWDAMTNPERIPRWFLPISGEFRRGGRFQLEGNAGGEITRCEAPKHLSLTWEFGGNVSWVRVSLTEVDGGSTRLELEHVAHVPDDFWEQFGPGAAGVGWDLSLVGLGEHLAGAPAFDHEEAEQWPASDEGRKLVAHCSDAWGEAAIAAGTPEAAAKGAAARTNAFFTGQEAPSSD